MNKKKLWLAAGSVLVFAFCLAFGSHLTVSATESEFPMTAVTDVNVRDAAGMHGDIIGVLSPGEGVIATGNHNGWYHVDYKGESGYVYHQWLTFAGTDENGDIAAGSEIDMYVATGVNIRSGPGTDYRIIGGLDEGEMVQVTGKTDGWCRVNHGGQTGYVYGQYLDFLASDSRASNTNSTSEAAGKTMTVNCRLGVNVRSAPTEKGEIIDSLEKGSAVTVIGSENGWYKVTYHNTTGYIYRQWLS